ncbi:MAG: S8 family peptidase [Candidatus Cyclobacteriaceae bacterium M2_1C_046]
MTKVSLRSLIVAFAAMAFMFSCTQEEIVPSEVMETSSSNTIEGQYIVVFNKSKTGDASSRFPGDYARAKAFVKENAQTLLRENEVSAEFIESIEHTYAATINGFSVRLDAAALDRLKNDDRVSYVENDQMVVLAPPCGSPNGSPCEGDGGDGGTTSQETPYGITRVNGGVTYTGTGVAWIIDTGIDLDHEDLNVDATRGYNAFTSGRDSKSLDDGNGHGTHVAGTVAAIDNSVGVIGVAAGATVVPVKVLDSRGSGSYSGVIAGVDHVAANGKSGDVANMSLGGGASQSVDDAVLAASANVKFSLAAGNDGADANNSSPARVNGSNIVTISAMDNTDTFASWSNWGNPPVDYCSPGVSIKSTWKDGGYNTISGTSMAAPHAAGILLLGNASTNGYVKGDPDGNPDPIMVH